MSAAVNHGTTWADGEIRGESKVQEELDGAVRNKAVFQDISVRARIQQSLGAVSDKDKEFEEQI